MARPLRIERAGGWYHVTSRGNERKSICRDDRDREHFLDSVAEMVSRFRVRLHGHALMDNHDHPLPEMTEANLSRAVQWLDVSYSVWHNRRHERSGHLLQGRFKSVVVSRDEWALALSRYLHLNPGLGVQLLALVMRLAAQALNARDRSLTGLLRRPDAQQGQDRPVCWR